MISAPSISPVDHAWPWRELDTRLRWVSIAPLGTPVVPPVYMRQARSAGSVATGSGSSGAEATTSWNQ